MTFLSKINTEFFVYLAISSLIIITVGDYIVDFQRLINFKIFLIILISLKINLISEIKKNINRKNTYAILIILFSCSVSVSYFFALFRASTNMSLLTFGYMQIMTNILVFVSLFFFFSFNRINYKHLFYSIIFPGLFFSIFLISGYLEEKLINNLNQKIIFFDNIRQVGLLLTFTTCFSIGYFLNNLKSLNYVKSFFIISVFLTLVILLGNRGSFISIILICFFSLIILKIKKIKISKIIILYSFCFIFSFFLKEIIMYLINNNLSVDWARDGIKTSSTEIFRSDIDSFNDRINQWNWSLKKIITHPFFGLGSNGFKIASLYEYSLTGHTKFAFNSHPHNFLIQFLLDWGLIGTTLILFLLGKLFYFSLNNLIKIKKNSYFISGLSILGLTIHGLVDGTYYHPTISFYLVLCLSILSAEINKKL